MQFWSVKEYAALYKVSRQTVYNRIEAGDIKAVRIGKLYRIPVVHEEPPANVLPFARPRRDTTEYPDPYGIGRID